MAIADNLKALRAKRHLTQEQLAAQTGIKQTAISRYEKGKNLPDVSSLLKLATGLRVPLEALAEGVDMKFDAMYRDFRVTIDTDEAPASDEDGQVELGAETAAKIASLPLGEIVHGAPNDAEVSVEAPTDMAASIRALHRTVSELVSITGRIAAGSAAVAGRVGSGVRARGAQSRHRTRPKHPPATAPKRR